MLLINLNAGDAGIISRVYNKQLEALGFTTKTKIKVINKNNSNMVVNVNGVRRTINNDAAKQVSIYG